MKPAIFQLAAVGLLLSLSPLSADEGFWLFSRPPRQQLKEKYGFELSHALLERLQKSSVHVGHGGSGSFVSADGLVLTNHHVARQWLQELSETGPDVLGDGFYAGAHDKELRCPGLELRVLWSSEDVTDRVHAAITPGMTPAAAYKARQEVLRSIEEESQAETGLDSETVCLYHGGRYELLRYKKYTDVRLVFAPEEIMSSLLDICFFRAYEDGKPAKVTHHLTAAPAPTKMDAMVLVSGHPGTTDRFRTTADLETLYGAAQFFRFKAAGRQAHAVATFAKRSAENKRHARTEAFFASNRTGILLGALATQEPLLARIRAREEDEQATLARLDPAAAKKYRHALDRIAACTGDGDALRKAYWFLESSHAFESHLFEYARSLLRLADESAKPPAERLSGYGPADCADIERGLLEPWTVNKELEIGKLAEALDLWDRYAAADAGLAAKILDGKTPRERARALIEGCRLGDVDVRKTLLEGGRDAVATSDDTMLALARLVDPRSRQIRRQVQEKISEPRRQAYAVLTRIREQSLGGAGYPDATSTLRLSFGALQPYDRARGMVDLAVVYANGNRLPKRWQAAGLQVHAATAIIFRSSADVAGGNSGSPVVDRDGGLVGVAMRGYASDRLGYQDKESGCYAVAADGILEVLDNVYHAAELTAELGRHSAPSRIVVAGLSLPPTLSVPQPLPPAVVAARQGSSLFRPARPKVASGPGNPAPTSLRSMFALPQMPSPAANPVPPVSLPASAPIRRVSAVNPLPSVDALLAPAKSPEAKASTPGKLHQELVPALIKALHDPDAEVRKTAADALRNLGGDAVPALIDALQAKDKGQPAAPVPSTSAGEDQRALRNLVRALADEDVQARRRAAHALASVVRDHRENPEAPPAVYPQR